MEVIRELVEEALHETRVMSLGTMDEKGPWVADVLFAHDDDLNIYWLSVPGTRHSEAIRENGKAAASITVSTQSGEDDFGLQVEGMAEKIEGDILEIARRFRRKRGKPLPEKEGEIFGEGESWYRLKPSKILLTYEPLWGYERKELVL